MAAQAGLDIVVKISDDEASPAMQTIGGLRSRSIALNNETVDVTSASSTGLWRELLAKGVRSATISGSGVFIDDTAATEIKDAFMEREVRDMEFTVPDLGTFDGSFLITALELGGEYNGEATFSATFESAGELTFTAA